MKRNVTLKILSVQNWEMDNTRAVYPEVQFGDKRESGALY